MKNGHTPLYPRSFRVTARPELVPAVEALLGEEGFRFEPEPFSPLCRRLTAEPFPLGSSLAAFFGYIYIQDRSSMLPPLALAPVRGATVVDMCSSPGSKTGLLGTLVGETGFVLANEVNHSRLNTLRMTLKTCNQVQCATCSYSGDVLPLADGSCSYIQLDPPCSGWGTVEKNPKVLELWKETKVRPLIQLQRRLLGRAAELLRPGGTVVYSTCTTNSDENELQVRYAEEELGLVRDPITPFEGFEWDDRPGSEGTLRVDGGRSQAQGFYIARLKKPGDAPAVPGNDGSAFTGGCDLKSVACATIEKGTLPPGRVAVFSGTARFLPAASEAFLPERFVWQGFGLGKVAGAGFKADPRLRVFMRDPAGGIVLESVQEIRSLLGGAARKTGLKGTEAGLWWRDLPLGGVSLRQGRIIPGFGR